MKRINENSLAREICWNEGRKMQLDIAQVKEVQRILLDHLAGEWADGNPNGVLELILKRVKALSRKRKR